MLPLALAVLAVAVLGPPDAAADERKLQEEERGRVLTAMLDVLSEAGFHVWQPDLSSAEARRAFGDRPAPRIQAVHRATNTKARHTLKSWQLKTDEPITKRDRLYRLEQAGTSTWGAPCRLDLWMDYSGREPQFPKAGRPPRPRKVAYRVDFKPRGPFRAERGTKPWDHVSRMVEGHVETTKRVEPRRYAGLEGQALITEKRGLLEGRAVAYMARGGYLWDGASERVRLDRVSLRARHRTALGWIELGIEAWVPIHPDILFAEPEIHALMEAFAALLVSGDAEPGGIGAVRVLDANPLFTQGRRVAEFTSPEELQHYVTQARTFVAADGVTQVVLEVEMEQPGVLRLSVPGSDASPLDEGAVAMLFGGRAVPKDAGADERLVAYALYTAPRSFAEVLRRSEAGSTGLMDQTELGVATRAVALEPATGASVAELAPLSARVEVRLVRPPAILVHGTFDEPNDCWESDARDQEPTLGTVSMATALRRVGYAVFKVDFSETNGKLNRDYERSSFRHNARVLWENDGGLFDAFRAYREGMGAAVTQADVVGHSLGGLIPRLWASDEYNPPAVDDTPVFDAERTTGYRRADNFGQGDIHRLVTIGTTHMGSDLGHLGMALHEAPVEALVTVRDLLKGPAAVPQAAIARATRKFLERKAFEKVGGWLGYGISPVVRDQQPHLPALLNPALEAIGATRVPSHAVVCAAAIPDVETFGGLYKYVLKVAAWWMLNQRPETVKAFFTARGQEGDLDRIFGEVLDLDRREGDADEAPGVWLFDSEHTLRPGDDYTLYALGRAMLFGNTQNDMVVRVESQAGGLPLQNTTFVRGVLHSFATRYERVQRAVVQALTGSAWRFHERGFPAPEPMRNIGSFEVDQDSTLRAEAIDASNIVAAHAEALSYVANASDVIIIMRPVNEHATTLIQRGMATKDMHVKGKSANWGPQRGFVACEQRFSKLHLIQNPEDRATQIAKFDGKVRECLAANRAREVPLRITIQGREHEVLVVEGDDLEPPAALVLRPGGGGDLKGWESGGAMRFDLAKPLPAPRLQADEIQRRGTRPLMVLADRHTGIPVTADYDIFAFGPRFEPGETESDPEMGFVIEWQKHLIRRMNNEIRLRANYAAGNVSHHGPETQFTFSEGADYPVSVFEPDGDIWILEEGPSGRKDLYTKRYFHVMRSQGWHLDPNPHTWNWGPYDPARWPRTGWRPEDDLQITATVLAADNPYDSDEGDEPIALGTTTGGR